MANGDVPPGIARANSNGPHYDPSRNVLDLVTAAIRRQDDLRDADQERINAELRNVRAFAELQASHAKELREMEAARLDSIRRVDVEAVSRTAEQSSAAIQALAVTTAATAETMRNSVIASATTLATSWAETVGGITTRLYSVEKSMFEGQGRSAGPDPQMAILISKIESLLESRSSTEGERTGTHDNRANITLWVAIAAIGVALYIGMNRTPVYLPSPAPTQQGVK